MTSLVLLNLNMGEKKKDQIQDCPIKASFIFEVHLELASWLPHMLRFERSASYWLFEVSFTGVGGAMVNRKQL